MHIAGYFILTINNLYIEYNMMKRIGKKNRKENYRKYVSSKKSKWSYFFSNFSKILMHRIYFMFIPHSKKKTKTLSLPVYSICIIVLVISLLLFTVFLFLTKNTVLASRTEILTGSYEERLDEINLLGEISIAVSTNENYRKDLKDMIKKSKIKTSSIFDTNIDNTNAYIDNLSKINAKAEELEKSKQYIDELRVNLFSKEKSLNVIPSILPVDSRYAIISRPYQKGSITSKGIGFETVAGTLIRSTASGSIESVNYDKNDGFTVSITHPLGLTTIYIGLATISVTNKQKLEKGQIIGATKTGEFEYELKVASEYVNPLLYTTENYGE